MSIVQDYILRKYPERRDSKNGKRMSKRQLGILSAWLEKKHAPVCKKEDDLCVSVLQWILYFDALTTPVAQLAACKWYCNATIRLPEDEYKVYEAVNVAKLNHLDPLAYDSPMEIVNTYGKVYRAEEAIDPSTVPTLHLHYRNDDGLEVYDVDESGESRENMRRIINTHFGENANPWCLLQGDGEGHLTENSAWYWLRYNAFPKRVAFKNGRLLAFSAGNRRQRVWWDRFDKPSEEAIIEEMAVPGDRLGRIASYSMDCFTGEEEFQGNVYRGDRENGLLEKFHSLEDEKPYSCVYQVGGKRLIRQWPGLSGRQEKEIGQASQLEEGIIRIPESIRVVRNVPLLKNRLLKEIHVSDGVQAIEDEAFYGNDGVREIHLPKSMTLIPNELFRGCGSLETVSLPVSLTLIPRYTFGGCKKLRNVNLPKTIEAIAEGAFYNCFSLREVHLPSKLKILPEKIFFGCHSLTTVKLPSKIKEIRRGAFSDCSSLESIRIPNSVTLIGESAFEGCTSLKEVILPSRLRRISKSLFKGCTSLRRIVLPPSVEVVDCDAFRDCKSLESILLPESLKEIWGGAFQGCRSLYEIDFPPRLEYIGSCAFCGCESLKEVLIPQSVFEVPPSAFSMCPGITLFLVHPRLFAKFYDRFGGRVKKAA